MILAKLKTWTLALFAVLAAIGSAWLYGRRKGKQVAENAEAARDAAANAQVSQDIIKTQESRHETDAEVQRLPDAPAQTVSTADRDTAAGRLQDWTRD